MYVGRLNKETTDISRATVDMTEWLDPGEAATLVVQHSITQGQPGWSDVPFSPPGSPLPYDPMPLLFVWVKLVDNGTGLEFLVGNGTPGNVYTCQFLVLGASSRQITFEVAVQITGQAPTPPSLTATPSPGDVAMSLYGGTMRGPLYLFRDPIYPTEAVTKAYADWAISQLHVENVVRKSGDLMTGYLSLVGLPTQPLHAATKSYVDAATGSSLHDAPADGTVYARKDLNWVASVDEAPAAPNIGYLRTNHGWAKGVLQATTTTDVRVTDAGSGTTLGIPFLSGMQTPPGPGSDYFSIGVRRTAAGLLGDGGSIHMYGPTTGFTNQVRINTNTAASPRTWIFGADGSLSAPGLATFNGLLRSDASRIVSHGVPANTLPSVAAWDQGLGVASGFWVGAGGTIGFGATDGNGVPQTTWASLSSSGLNVTNYSGYQMNLTGPITVGGSVISSGSLYARGGALFYGPGDTGYLTSDGTNAALRFRSDNWNLYWNGATGTLSFNRPGATMWSVDASGNGWFASSVQAGNLGMSVPGLGGGYTNYSAFSWDGNIINYAANGAGAGQIMRSNTAGGSGYTGMWRMEIAPGGAAVYAWYTLSAAIGWSASTVSDRRTKSNIQPAGDALTKLLAIPVYECDRTLPEFEPRHMDFSVMSDEVFAQIPSMAIRSDDPAMFDMIDPLVADATMIRAIQQLAERVSRLENPTPA